MRVTKKILATLQDGGVAVMPTDTIYGIVGSALRPKTVERIYRLRRRNRAKPMIVLISSFEDLRRLSIRIAPNTRKTLGRLWPGKVSVVLPCPDSTLHYLHRGTRTLACRMPKPLWLRSLIARTGPLVAPSANIEGEFPSRNVRDAKRYFGNGVDIYMKGTVRSTAPSTLITLKKGEPVVLRKGAVKL